ncbi:MAG: class I SAM-dependent methyltransferase [Bacteroidota bacterium]
MGVGEQGKPANTQPVNGMEIEKELQVYKNWFDKTTTDIWRHVRMLSVLDPFLEHHKNASWVTIGDGRFGTSSTYIQRKGGKTLATDINVTLLEVAKQNQMIPEFAYANAEALPFKDDQFDYAYCKQAYHHFSKPTLAVYEMLRVSKRAIIFTEPHDFAPAPFTRAMLQKIKHGLKKIMGKKVEHHDTGNYETVGNYVYGISVRDFEKIALGINLPCIAYKRFNDVYIPGMETELFTENASLYTRAKHMIWFGKLSTFFGLSYPNTIQMIIFKTKPDEFIAGALKKDGYKVINFSPNPYL